MYVSAPFSDRLRREHEGVQQNLKKGERKEVEREEVERSQKSCDRVELKWRKEHDLVE